MLNEAESIQNTLCRVLQDTHVHECFAVDGGSTDDTVDRVRCLDDPRVTVLNATKGRGSQMNAGAAMASGDALVFLHADTVLPAGFGGAIIGALDQDYDWGCFVHSFAPNNWRLRLVSLMHNLRCRVSGVVYGDQGMFIRRQSFEALNGFPEQQMEDVAFSNLALAAIGQPVIVPHRLQTDSRKFIQIGEFRALAQVVSILLRYRRGEAVANQEFFENYR